MNRMPHRSRAESAFRLMSPRSARRWGRVFVFAWLCMWVGAALLPCCEVEAAVAAQSAPAHDCAHGADSAPDSGSHKTGPCMDVAAPAPAVAEKLAGPAGDAFAPQMLEVPLGQAVFSPQTHPPPVVAGSAPPPLAVHVRTTRLLI